MTDEAFSRISDGQRDCLRLKLRHYQIKEIARELKISPSTVNQRLERARTILGATSVIAAARMVAEHEGWSEIWIQASWSPNPLQTEQQFPSSDPATNGIGTSDAALPESGRQAPDVAQSRPSAERIKWPFPTAGRPDNDLSAIGRVAWVIPVAILSVMLLIVVAILSLGLQDMLAGLQGVLAHLS